ncbi:MAG TPA: hypothetical protein VEZ14_06810 [Dehalococcoidia bacterium]|nr:hypothetical protein [Dehalococcoidia bacterium]
MWRQDVYVAEKLRELEAARPRRAQLPPEPPRQRRRVLGPIARRAGQGMCIVGEALEAWAAPPPRNARWRG